MTYFHQFHNSVNIKSQYFSVYGDSRPWVVGPATLFNKRLRHRFFPAKFAKFLKTLFYRPPFHCLKYIE